MSPRLIIEYPQRFIVDNHDSSRIIHCTSFDGQAMLVDMGTPSGTDANVDVYDEDEVSDLQDDKESPPKEEL